MNAILTLLSNMFSNVNLTDMETCYKVYRTELLKSLPIRSDRFGIEPELTMKSAKRNFRIYEVPISYHGRTYEEGKKIDWKDGVKALATILRFWLIDDLYAEPYGRGHLNNLTGTPQYLNWMTRVLKPFAGDSVIEIGGGIGNLAARLLERRLRYVVCEADPLYLHALGNRFLRTPHVQVDRIDPVQPEALEKYAGQFDTALCVNVLEYLDDPGATLAALGGTLRPEGRLLLLVPQNPWLYGPVDRRLGHKQRFRRNHLESLLAANGFRLEKAIQFNRFGALAWLLFSKALRRDRVSKPFLKVFDKTVWLWRRIDRLFPWPGLSLIVVASKRPA
jgi:SAM-dependent methyltransferase